MPRERMAWLPMSEWGAKANGLLRRLWELAEGTSRTDVRVVTGDPVTLSWTFTLLLGETSAGHVSVTLPDAAQHVGYRVDAKRLHAGHSFTVNGTSANTGVAFVSDGVVWHVLP